MNKFGLNLLRGGEWPEDQLLIFWFQSSSRFGFSISETGFIWIYLVSLYQLYLIHCVHQVAAKFFWRRFVLSWYWFFTYSCN